MDIWLTTWGLIDLGSILLVLLMLGALLARWRR